MGTRHTITVAGAGGIGSAVALLLRELGDLKVDLYLGDRDLEAARRAADWILEGPNDEGTDDRGRVLPFELPESGGGSFEEYLDESQLLLDCLPGSQAPRMAELARRHRLHYANLTEYVAETEQVMEIARGAEQGFLLQTGLAPGFINVLGHGLFQRFCRRNAVDAVDSVAMRVGALSKNALPPHYYGFTWSPIGVATEYLKPAIVVRDFQKTTRQALTEVQALRIKGQLYEEALTSGGAADLPDALAGRVRHLDYKTLRYPHHWEWVKEKVESIPSGAQREIELQKIMEREIPFVEDDLVVIYANVEGVDRAGRRSRLETSQIVEPLRLGKRTLRAIQATTAAALAESARMLLGGSCRGVVLQSQIDPEPFLYGPFIRKVYFSQSVRDAD